MQGELGVSIWPHGARAGHAARAAPRHCAGLQSTWEAARRAPSVGEWGVGTERHPAGPPVSGGGHGAPAAQAAGDSVHCHLEKQNLSLPVYELLAANPFFKAGR